MAISHAISIRNALAALVAEAVDEGDTEANGQLVFQSAEEAEVATVNFSAQAFGNPANGIVTAAATSDDTNATGGTVTQFKIVNRDGATVISGTVTPSGGGGDIELSSTTIGAGDTVSVTALTYEASE